MQGITNGKDVIFLVKNGDEYQPYVCAKDFSIETTSTLIQVATVGDGQFDKFKYQSIGYTITMSGVARMGEGIFSAFEALMMQMNFLELEYKAHFTSEDGQEKTIKGVCLIERNSISGNAGQLALNDMSLRGSGKPIFIDCDAVILNASVETDGNDAVVQIFSIEGFPATYYYQLDSDMEFQSGELSFRFSSVPEGYHTILITPACESGKRGESYSLDWANLANPINPTCGVPVGFTLIVTSDTTMTVSWGTGLNNTSVDLTFKNLSTGATFVESNLSGTSFNATGLLPGATYAVTIRANCGSEKSATVTANKTMTNSGPRPYVFIKNFSTNVRLYSVSVNGVVAFSTVVEPNSSNDFQVDPGPAEITITYEPIDDFDASITVQNSGRRLCQPTVLPVEPHTASWGTFSIGTEGLEININSFACIG